MLRGCPCWDEIGLGVRYCRYRPQTRHKRVNVHSGYLTDNGRDQSKVSLKGEALTLLCLHCTTKVLCSQENTGNRHSSNVQSKCQEIDVTKLWKLCGCGGLNFPNSTNELAQLPPGRRSRFADLPILSPIESSDLQMPVSCLEQLHALAAVVS